MSIYDKLNEMQKEAVITTEGPLLILAGAGSGKTSVLTHRIAYLIDEVGVNPYNIMAITFTNKAAGEMRERVDKLVGFGAEHIFVSTFHSACVRILRRYIDQIGYDTTFTIYDTDDQKQIMKEVCKKLQIDTKQLKERTLMNYISSAKDELVSPDEFSMKAGGDYQKRRVASVYQEYQAALKKNNALDFDDLLMKTVELFRSCPEVLSGYQNRWKYIMVDEYQDTNTAQFELIRLLASANRNLCVVGDDDQSIYKFRGANIRNILDFEKVYPEAKVVKLEQNYRSVQTILDAANAVIHNNTARKEKSLWSKKDVGDKIHFRQFENAYEEAEYISDTILHDMKNGDCEYRDQAVLYRTNAQSRMLEERFVHESIPYIVVGGVNFYARREIKDLLAYLKTIDNGKDDLAVKRIINIPKRGIGATTLQKIQEYADNNGISLFDAMRACERIEGMKSAVCQKIYDFVNMILLFRAKLENLGLSRLFGDILDSTEYILKMDVEDEEEAEDRISNIDELRSKIVYYEETEENPTLSGFLEEVALVADIDSVTEDDNRVVLMTIHSAKGLEFKNVFLAGMEDGLFPSYMSISTNNVDDIEEERRLAYVAITRAKESLTISCAKSRMIRGETQYNPVSRFVREIPKELMDSTPAPKKSYDEDLLYDDDSEELNNFKKKPFMSSYSNGFDFTSSKRAESKPLYSSEDSLPIMNFSKPKATFSQKKTAEENKPFIAKSGLDGLTKGVAMTSGEISYTKGDRVLHKKYGAGTVLNVVKETRDYKVTVLFDGAGQKIMYAAFAKLEKI